MWFFFYLFFFLVDEKPKIKEKILIRNLIEIKKILNEIFPSLFFWVVVVMMAMVVVVFCKWRFFLFFFDRNKKKFFGVCYLKICGFYFLLFISVFVESWMLMFGNKKNGKFVAASKLREKSKRKFYFILTSGVMVGYFILIIFFYFYFKNPHKRFWWKIPYSSYCCWLVLSFL